MDTFRFLRYKFPSFQTFLLSTTRQKTILRRVHSQQALLPANRQTFDNGYNVLVLAGNRPKLVWSHFPVQDG